MKIIIKNPTFQIGQDEDNKYIYKIFFSSYNEEIIKSITKTKIILGATTTEKYNTLTFKATSVQTFKQFQEDLERETEEKKRSTRKEEKTKEMKKREKKKKKKKHIPCP